MRILLVSTYPPRRCGIGDYTADLARALNERPGIELTVLTYGEGTKEELATNNEVKVVRGLEERTSPNLLSALLGGLEPDLIHLQSSTFLHDPSLNKSVVAACRVPLVATVHDAPSSWRVFYTIPSLRRVYTKSSVLFTHSVHVLTILRSFHRVDGKRLCLLPHGVDVETYHPDAGGSDVLAAYGIEQGRVVLYFGFLRPGKGLETLLKAWKKVARATEDAVLVVAGGSPTKSRRYAFGTRTEVTYPNRLKTLARDLGVESSVVFTGYVPREQVPRLLASSEIIVLPYDRGWSPSGPLHKALSSGRPIIASSVPGFTNLLEHGNNALLTQPGDAEAFADSIALLLNNRTFAEELGIRARSFAKTILSWGPIAEKTLNVYADCLSTC